LYSFAFSRFRTPCRRPPPARGAYLFDFQRTMAHVQAVFPH
jgi:hypothetical protein